MVRESGASPDDPEAPQSAGPASPPRGAGQRVLLVDDNESVRRGFERLLVRLGYTVTAVESAEQAEELARKQTFALLLTDLTLPGASGAELAGRLRERWPDLPVVLTSGYAEDEAVPSHAAGGPLRFLPKPVDLATLAREVHEALGNAQ